jgi:hypothetical protein
MSLLAADQSGNLAPGTPLIDLDLSLHANGSASRAMAESSGGNLQLYVHGGRIEQRGLRFLLGSLLYQLFDVIKPFSDRQNYIDIECAGGHLDVVDGVASTNKGVVIQTPELQVVGFGTVNLAAGQSSCSYARSRPIRFSTT